MQSFHKMSIDADEAKRLIQVLNNATAAATDTANATAAASNVNNSDISNTNVESLEERDVSAILRIFSLASKEKSQTFALQEKEIESRGEGEEPLSELGQVDISRFKQIALSALRYSMAASLALSCSQGSRGIGIGSGSGIAAGNGRSKIAKRIVLDGLLPLTNLPSWIESFIISAIDLLIQDASYQQQDENDPILAAPVSTIGIEFLLVPFIARIHPDQAAQCIRALCCNHPEDSSDNVHHPDSGNGNGNDDNDNDDNNNNDGNDNNVARQHTMINPHCAAAITAAISEIHNLSPILTHKHVSSLAQKLLHSLRTLANMKEYESIPPIIYQLCGLTKISFRHTNANSSAKNRTNTNGKARGFGHSKETQASFEILYGIADFLSLLFRSVAEEEEVRWTICTSLSHLSRVLRNNPALPHVLLQISKGKQIKRQGQSDNGNGNGCQEGLRYKRMTPMILALGMTMASSIPRMKISLLEAVRNLVLEEELMRCKRFESRFVNAIVALMGCGTGLEEDGNLKGGVIGKEKLASMEEDLERYTCAKGEASEEKVMAGLEDHSDMLQCMKCLVLLTKGGKDGGNSPAIDAEFSTLIPTLISLGFMLVDSVKKDTVVETPGNCNAYQLPPIPTCASEVVQNSLYAIQQQANANVAKIGRSLLVHLFLCAGVSHDDEGVVTVSGFSTTMASPQCRLILQTACEKFCGMAPNALEHSILLKDLVLAKNREVSNTVTNDNEGLGAHIIEESFVPMIIDLLANIPGGGMPPLVARRTIIPVLDTILKVSAEKGRGNRRKRNALDDHIDHCFLLAKKALFCTDIDRRKVAVHLLVTIIGVAVERSGDSRALLDEVKGYLRRCMTQHQGAVRLEVYSSLVALIPESQDNNELSQSQSDDVSSGCKLEPVVSRMLQQHIERYITVEEDAAIIEARRKRAIAHGTLFSQQMDVEMEECDGTDKDCPLRIDLCISSGRATANIGRQLGSSKRSKNRAKSLDLLTEAVDRISEPISFLLGTSLAVVEGSMNKVNPIAVTTELHTTLLRLRSKMADTDLKQCMKWCEGSKCSKSPAREHYIRMLSTCMIVASVCETLMGAPAPNRVDDIDLELIGKLFRLRSDAVYKAAAIITSAKTNHNKIKNKKTAKRKEADDDDVTETVSEHFVLIGSDSDANRKCLYKAKMSVEDSLQKLSPSMGASFLNGALRECGILGQSKSIDDILHGSQDEDEDVSVKSKLTSNESFRRFLLDKCCHLVSGKVLMIKVGHRFDIQCHSTQSEGSDTATKYIAPVFMLAPVLLSEFVSHTQSRDHTSLTLQVDVPLSLVALNGFVTCAQRLLNTHTPSMSSQMKITSLIRSSIATVSNHFHSFKENWNSRTMPSNFLCNVPDEEKKLLAMIFPFVMPMEPFADQPARASCGFIAEILHQGLDIEASKFCELMKCVGNHLTVESRQVLSLLTIESFRVLDSVEVIQGIVGLDLGSDDVDCSQSASAAIDTSVLLDGLIDGSTELPHLSGLPHDQWRRNCCFTATKTIDLQRITGRSFEVSEFRSLDGDNLVGTLQLLASSMQASNPIGTNFDGFTDIKSCLFKFTCTDVVSAKVTSSELVPKDLSTASTSILAAIDYGIADIEFLTNKILPHVIGNQIALVQRFVCKLLYSVGKIICTTSLCSEAFDDNGHYSSSLLKSCKRLYASYTKLLGYLPHYPMAVNNDENIGFLRLIKEKLHSRTMALLLTLSEKLKVGNKALADSKISSHGRIAEQVVFELERCDNALLKLSAKLKTAGFQIESTFVLDQMGSGSKVRGFKIKEKELKEIRDRVVLENTSKKRKKVKPEKRKRKASKDKKRKSKNDSDGSSQSQGESHEAADDSLEDNQSISEDASMDNGSDDDQSMLNTIDGDDGDESGDGDSIVGKFVINSASEDSESEDDDGAETEDEL